MPTGPGRYAAWRCYGPADAHPAGASRRATVHSARLDALVGRAVREALRLYGHRGFRSPPTVPDPAPCPQPAHGRAQGATHMREARWKELQAAGLAAGPAPPAPAEGPSPADPAGPPRPAPLGPVPWEGVRDQARDLWPEADWQEEDAWGTLWDVPLLEANKRRLLCGLGAMVAVRVLPPDPPLPLLSRNLSQRGGRLRVRLDCPALGCGGPDAYALEEAPGEHRAFRRWQCRSVSRAALGKPPG